MRLPEKVVKAGYFWLPPTPDVKLPGTLKISESAETELEVLGIFGDVTKLFQNDPGIERINGVVEGEGFVTLDKCFYKNRNLSSPGISKSIIHVNRVFLGAAYGKEEPIRFSTLTFSVEGLDEWLGISGLKTELLTESKGTIISYFPPKEIRIKLTADIDLLFTFESTMPFGPSISEAKITQKAYVKLESKKLLPLEDFTLLAFRLNNFLCFAIDESTTFNSMVGTSFEVKRKINEKAEIEVPIKIFYPTFLHPETAPKIHWPTMLFRYSDVANDLEEILAKWLGAYERIEPAFNLYFASRSGANKFINTEFLALAQGLETFHRRTSNETTMSDIEFNATVATLLVACPQPSKEWLKGTLQYANEISLRKRLAKMIEPFKSYFGTEEERKALINNIVNTRNYLVHYDKRLKDKVLSVIELMQLCMKMEGLFQLHLLRTVGFSNDAIDHTIHNNAQLIGKLAKPNKIPGSNS